MGATQKSTIAKNPKPSVEENDSELVEKVDDTEGEDDKANQLRKKYLVEMNIPDSGIGVEDNAEAQDDKADQLEEEEHVEKVTDEEEINVEIKEDTEKRDVFSKTLDALQTKICPTTYYYQSLQKTRRSIREQERIEKTPSTST